MSSQNLLKYLVSFVLTLCLGGPGDVWAESRVLAVQSVRALPYEEALGGFQELCGCRLETLVLSETQGLDLRKRVAESRPDLVLAMGSEALARLRGVERPLMYIMVFDPASILAGEGHIPGVSMNLPAEMQLRLIHRALPAVRRIGLLYDPARSVALVEKGVKAAGELGLRLNAIEVRAAEDVPAALSRLKGVVDVVWLLPDLTVVTPETVEAMVFFSMESRVPLVAFSDKYLKLGAFMSIGIDPGDIGRQGGEMARNILAGLPAGDIASSGPRKALVKVNFRIAEKLQVRIDEAVLNEPEVVE